MKTLLKLAGHALGYLFCAGIIFLVIVFPLFTSTR